MSTRDLLVTITALDEDGRGVGAIDGRELRVACALPGETVRARVRHESPHRRVSWADCIAVVSAPAPERVSPSCPAFGTCGGCALQHLAVPAQLAEKRARVVRAIAAAGVVAPAPTPTVGAERVLGYRNRSKLVLAPGGPLGIRWGAYAPASHDLVDLAGCRVPEEPLDALAEEVVRAAAAKGLTAHDERAGTGELRHLVLRRVASGALLVVVVARGAGALPGLRAVAEAVRAGRAEVAGVVAHLNDRPGGAIFAETGEDHLLAGVAEVEEDVGPVRLTLSARSFFQVHREQAAGLYAAVAREVGVGPMIDLYSGAGGIALTAALAGATVVGVESLAAAVDDATRSARAAAASARFLVGDAADGLPRAAALLGGTSAVVVNPPRKGLSAAARAAVLALAPPKLVYVSCEPVTLARDLAEFCRAGWNVTRLSPWDLLPGTPHVETLAVLAR